MMQREASVNFLVGTRTMLSALSSVSKEYTMTRDKQKEGESGGKFFLHRMRAGVSCMQETQRYMIDECRKNEFPNHRPDKVKAISCEMKRKLNQTRRNEIFLNKRRCDVKRERKFTSNQESSGSAN